ncbi:MAG TPA: two-component regulator propeller domain-containing protein [Chryseosolibacter sp.]|nr:two-component regulator propeller domain-containing protein [Chryseosolibacter sp.]
MKRVRSVLVLLAMLLAMRVFAQQPFFQVYRLLNQRERVEVNTMLQDSRGYMWFATTQGLFQFDGQNYTRFTTADSLADNNVTAMCLDSAGALWIGYNNGKISCFKEGRITAFNPDEGTSHARISDILFDHAGNLWFSTLNDGLYYYTAQRLFRLDEQEGMPDLYIYDLALDAKGRVLAGTDGGVAICSLTGKNASIEVLNQHDGLPDNIIRKIITSPDGYWLGSEDAGIIRYRTSDNSFALLHSGWEYGAVYDMAVKKDQLWIASAQGGIMASGLEGIGLVKYENMQQHFSSVSCLYVDGEMNIWAGSRNGVARTVGNGIAFFRDLPDDNVLAVCRDLAGGHWFSTSAGLFKGNAGADGNLAVTRPLADTRYQDFTIISLYTDVEGQIWAGLYGEGVLRIDPLSGKIVHFEKELRNGNILNIAGRANEIWMATLGGATRVRIENGKVAFRNYSSQEGLSSDFIYQVFPDSRGRIWFATDGKGVDMLDDTGFHHFQQGLPSKIVYGFAEDRQERIWANVQGNGLFVFDGRESFRPVDASLKPRKNELHALASDADGNLIVAHDEGLDLIDASGNKIKYLGEESGLDGMIVNLNAASRDVSGALFLGTGGGIIRLSDSEQFLSRVPVPTINGVRIFDRPVDLSMLDKLAYDENNLTFNFTGIWYQNPEQLFFNYKLENYDAGWLESRNNSVTYSRLPPGQYVFRVRVSETESFANSAEATVLITIRPPFWRTYTFYFFALVVASASAYALIKFRERKLRYNNMLLEARVRARTREIQRQNDEIQAQNEEISAQAEEIKGINENLETLVHARTAELEQKNKALEEYAFINAHKLRSPVASILGLAHLMTKTNLDPEGKEINLRLQQAVDELDDVVRSITKAIESGDRELNYRDNKSDV